MQNMRGVGGPLLCVGDLLSDVAGDDGDQQEIPSSLASPPPSSLTVSPNEVPLAADLPRLFEENYNELDKSLKGTDHSWTALTLKLCSALETADKLVNAASSNVESLAEKIRELEVILKRGDSLVAAAKDVWDRTTGKECDRIDNL